MLHKVACYLFLAAGLSALIWDAVLAEFGCLDGNSWCQAARDINRSTEGLLAMGWFILGIHIFFRDYLPAAWLH